MKERLTLRLDAGIVADACALAANREMSLNALLREQLLVIVRERQAFTTAKASSAERLRMGQDKND